MLGNFRRLDDIGRIVIPIEMRNALDIAQKDPVEISLEFTSPILFASIEPSHIPFLNVGVKVVHAISSYCISSSAKAWRTTVP